MSQTANEKRILNELIKVEKTLASQIKGNEKLKKEIDRIKELINYIPGSFINNKSKKTKK